MDLRQDVLGIIIGGTPAPGINGVISSVTLEALNNNMLVCGFFEGWKHLRAGVTSKKKFLTYSDVSRIHNRGGSLLRTSKMQLSTPDHIENTIRALSALRVKYLVTVGGTETAFSANSLLKAVSRTTLDLQLVHCPKTIFNDLPIISGVTFGYSTARGFGARIVSNLIADCKALLRWYVVVVIGSKSGHLALGIGKAAAATLIMIPEQFPDGVVFEEIVNIIDACMVKRCVMGKDYGVVVISEALVDLMAPEEITRLFGNTNDGHSQIGNRIASTLTARWDKERGRKAFIRARDVGFELRAAEPDAFDVELSRELGYGAVRTMLKGTNGVMISIQDDDLQNIPLSSIVDEKTQSARIRTVNVSALNYEVARKYMICLTSNDLKNKHNMYKLCKLTNLSHEDFLARYTPVINWDAKSKGKKLPMALKGHGARFTKTFSIG